MLKRHAVAVVQLSACEKRRALTHGVANAVRTQDATIGQRLRKSSHTLQNGSAHQAMVTLHKNVQVLFLPSCAETTKDEKS